MNDPLFILGCPRSGTTFLASVLRDSSYGVPFESQFIVKFFKKLERYGSLEEYRNFSALLHDILKERAILQRGLKLDPRTVFAAVPDRTYRALVDHVCFAVARRANENNSSWGEKTPHYTLDLEVLLELFADSRFIYLTRDGRDVALSLMKKPWGPGTVYACARLWKEYLRKKAVLDRLAGHKAHFVRYEELLRHPEREIRRVYEFLGEETPSLEALAGRTRRDNFNKWKTEMSGEQVEVFERTAASTLAAEGYSVTWQEGGLKASEIARFACIGAVKRMRHLVRSNLLDGLAIRFLGKEPFNE